MSAQATPPPLIVDAHEDIAYNALSFGRNYAQSVQVTRRAEANSDVPQHTGRATLGLPEWLAGRVAVVFSTIFVMPDRAKSGPWELQSYRDPQEAYRRGIAQLEYYRRFVGDHPETALIGTRADLEAVLAGWESPDDAQHRVGFVPLMEGADPIREPKEVEEWYERGVRIVGLAWTATRYAGGTHAPGPLTQAGRELLDAMADTGMILDVSHLSEESCAEALDRYEGAVIASHTNPRALTSELGAGPDRHFSDEMIARLVERDGVEGIIPLNNWLKRSYVRGDPKESVTLEHLVAAIDHVCQIAGDARHVGLGTDFDGGFGAERIPAEFDTVADLGKLGPALAAHGYSAEDVEAVLGGNWLRVLRAKLP